jgi:hypothetical protein
MRFLALSSLFATLLLLSAICAASNPSKHDCVPFSEASKHVGTTQCVSGTVMRVEEERSGVSFLKFCKDSPVCPFTVVVFAGDQKKVGDIRQLQGRQIEIKGTCYATLNNWEKAPLSWFLPCPPTTTSNVRPL